MISPAPIAQVADLQFEILAQLWTSALGSVFLDLVLDLSGIHQVKLQVRNIKNISKLVVTALLFLSSFLLRRILLEVTNLVLYSCLLTLLELISVIKEVLKLGSISLVLCKVIAKVTFRYLACLLHSLHLLE